MLIAEELLLLLTDDTSGKPVVGSTELEHGLAGAVLLELAMSGRVDVEPGRGFGRKERLVVTDGSAVGEPVLDEALRRIAQKPGRKPETVLGALRKGLRDNLYERLATQGVLRAERTKVLGLFAATHWPTVDPSCGARLRQALYDTLVVGREPAPPVAALVSLLFALRAIPKVVERGPDHMARMDRTERKRVQARAKQISEGAWAAAAVRRAVDAVNAATVAAITVVTAGGAAGAAGG